MSESADSTADRMDALTAHRHDYQVVPETLGQRYVVTVCAGCGDLRFHPRPDDGRPAPYRPRIPKTPWPGRIRRPPEIAPFPSDPPWREGDRWPVPGPTCGRTGTAADRTDGMDVVVFCAAPRSVPAAGAFLD